MFENAAIAETGEPGAPSPSTGTCDLCGLPLGRAARDETVDGIEHHFCCPGCRYVFLILSTSADRAGSVPDFRNTELFRTCLEAGIIPGRPSFDASPHMVSGGPEMPSLPLSLHVDGMWCPACGWLVEEALKRVPGVTRPTVSFSTDTAHLSYQAHLTTPEEIKSHIKSLGYGASDMDDRIQGDRSRHDLLVRLCMSAILTVNVMMLSAALYFGFVKDLTPMVKAFFSYPILILAAPVLFYGGMPILKRAWAGMRLGVSSMDTLISLGALSAFGYSLVQISRGSIHLYFDTAAMLITIVLLGRYVELHARERVFSSIASGLAGIGPGKVRLREGASGRWVPASEVTPGDCFIIKEGEAVGVDGRITEGSGFLDQSAITGETTPVFRQQGDDIMAGSLVTDGNLEVTATRSSRESSLGQIADLMLRALDMKDSREQLADSVGRIFVPVIICLALVTGITLAFFHVPADEILLRCLTVLLISCPCVLGIATPLAKVAVIGLGRRKGILVTNPGALETIPALTVMVLDKTGTLTEGRFTLHSVVSGEEDEKEVLSRIAPLEAGSHHFLAREIVRRARDLGLTVRKNPHVEEIDGMGVRGKVGDKVIFAGNRRLVSLCDSTIPAGLEERAGRWEEEAMTVVFFGTDNVTEGCLVFGDPLRQGARELTDWLHNRGTKVLLLSGDGEKTTAAVAGRLGIQDYMGQKSPVEKAEIIKRLQREGHKVGMAGDGINDAGAVASADVGFSVGPGNNILKSAADLIMPDANPRAIIDAFHLAAKSRRITRQNLSFAFLYNATAIPIAAAGLLNPLIAVAAMFLSSLTVTGNALRASKGFEEDKTG